MTHDGPADHVEQNRRFWDDEAAAWHGPLARDHWAQAEPSWGLWSTPESQVSVLPDNIDGMRAIELGCGTAYVSAWLARAGAHPVGIDLSEKQLATARAMQAEFGIDILEVVAYLADEAESGHGGLCQITLYPDGSVAVADNGRGTDTRLDEHGHIVKKPVMATKDLRFFDNPDAPSLPDTHIRRGMSVVAALSTWLIHTNRRLNGSWTQRYEHGVPTTDLRPIVDDLTTGTTVHFLPDELLRTTNSTTFDDLARLTQSWQ